MEHVEIPGCGWRWCCRTLGRGFACAVLASMSTLPLRISASEPPLNAIEFNRDILPILSDACFHCHGPDKARRKADLRLDIEAEAKADRDGIHVITAGDPANSELYRRITVDDPDDRMPPVDSGRNLTPDRIELIRQWIEQGAQWQKHWAFIPPLRPKPPSVKAQSWLRNPVDAFILSRLEQEGLSPSRAADKATLIRRVTLDLTGLPPTPKEVDAFHNDSSAKAYEKLVDRLLASPRYGERMATRWLDAARYADTSGYQNDGPRTMWRWRDWVIDAFNDNMPFDQFTMEQIAGDLLPDSTLSQKIATGFNRNHRGNSEGGVIPEEYAVEYVVDRVDTTATVWLGLTLGCARCHDHKYDPFTQKEFYQFFAYFNNIPESGRSIKEGNSPPWIKAPTEFQQRQLAALNRQVKAAEQRLKTLQPELQVAQAEWESLFVPPASLDWSVAEGLLAHFSLNGSVSETLGKAKTAKFQDGQTAFAEGRLDQAAEFDGRRFIDAGDIANFGYFDKFSIGAWIYPEQTGNGTILSRTTDTARSDGYSFCLQDGKLQVNLVKRWLDDAIRVETEGRLEPDRWHHVMLTYDGTRVAKGIRIYINGHPQKLHINLDFINQSFASTEPLRIGAGGGREGRFRGRIDDVRVYEKDLSPGEVEQIATPDSVAGILALPRENRSPRQANKLSAYFLENHAPQEIQRARRQLISLQRQQRQFLESIPTVMVMEEMPVPRPTFVLARGEYDKPAEKVNAGVPAIMNPLPAGVRDTRLGLAKWLVDPANPLPARVAVNRFWQMYFGVALVKTVEDFGTQGQRPSHPELLDWLATEFIRIGWDIKALQKTIVMSATYRQSSKVTPALLDKDPDNRLLARGPRIRLSAQLIRDQALAASGLLVNEIGGPSVKPYQPEGLWEEIATGGPYHQDKGDKLYRRSLYTYWKRTVAPPSMVNFDASMRESCRVRENRTNTPLQALTLMNEITYVEAARMLAQRVILEAGISPEQRLSRLFRLVTARTPQDREMKILLEGLHHHLQQYRNDRQSAEQLIASGDSQPDPLIDAAELAAYTAISSLMLNLDEVITKQ